MGTMHCALHRWLPTLQPRGNDRRKWNRNRGLILEQSMISITDAFRKFRSNLELTQKEQDDASRRQQEIRGVMDTEFKLEDSFLSGSYRRFTKTKPLKDVDIFCVFH